MPNIKAAKKALRQSNKRRALNDAKKKKIKELSKQAEKAFAEKSDTAADLVKQLVQALDKAAKTHTIHRNRAARLKSSFQKKLNTLLK